MEGGLYVVSTPIGNLGDITARAVETLRQADVVYAEDTRRTRRLLAHLGVAGPVRSLHAHNEMERVAEVLERLERGELCVLVSDAGTPAVSDPGRRIVAAALEAGQIVLPVPGPSAVLAALSASGLSGDRFLFLGFPPRTGRRRREWLDGVVHAKTTVVAFESPKRLARLLEDLVERGIGERTLAVGREMTKLHEEVVRGTVRELLDRYGEGEVRGEVTLVLEAEPPRLTSNDDCLEAAAGRAGELTQAGHSMREIAGMLRDELGLARNEAYRVALEVSTKEEP